MVLWGFGGFLWLYRVLGVFGGGFTGFGLCLHKGLTFQKDSVRDVRCRTVGPLEF